MTERVVTKSGRRMKVTINASHRNGAGQLIATPISIQPPDPPQCISPKCIFRFIIQSLFVTYLSSYHRRRVAYAERNRPERGKEILEKYRTGEEAPKTLCRAIYANIKLINKV